MQVAVADVNGDGRPDRTTCLTTDGTYAYDGEGNRTRKVHDGLLVTGAGVGGTPHVKVYVGDNGALRGDFLAYAEGFTGGVQVAVGDVNGDGTPDVITGAGPGGGPQVRVFDGTDLTGGTLLASFFACDTAFPGGVFVAAADLNGDGHAEIVTAPASNGGPHVKVFEVDLTGAATELHAFFAYETTMNAGVRIAVGDVNGDGTPDIITGPGKNFASLVRVFDGTNQAKIAEFPAFDPAFLGGVYLAAGEINGNGKAEIIAGAGPGGGPAVRVYDGASASLTGATLLLPQFLAYVVEMKGGVRVGAVDADGDGRTDILTVPGKDFPAHAKAFEVDSLTGATELYNFFAYDTSFKGGAFVSGNGANFEEVLYTWDHRNRLTGVTERNANGRAMKEVEYTYDVYNRLIAKRVDEEGNGTFDRGEKFVYDGRDLALAFDQSGSLTDRYLYGPGLDQVFADENAVDGILWALTDNQGTVRDIAKYDAGTNATAVVNHRKYDSFGKMTSESNATIDFLPAYTGRPLDEDTGLQNHETRWYDTVAHVWISQDWIGFAAGDANLYRYVANSATNFIDPDGREWIWNWDWSGFGSGYVNSLNRWSSKAQPPVDGFDRFLRGAQKGAVITGGVAGVAAGGLAVGAATGVTTVGTMTMSELGAVGYTTATGTAMFLQQRPELVEGAFDAVDGALSSNSPTTGGRVVDGVINGGVSLLPDAVEGSARQALRGRPSCTAAGPNPRGRVPSCPEPQRLTPAAARTFPTRPGGTGAAYDELNGQGVYILRDSSGNIEYVGRGDAPERLLKHARPGSGKEDLVGKILFNNNLPAAQAMSLEQELMQMLGGPASVNPSTSLRNRNQGIGESNPNFLDLEFAADDDLVIEALRRAGLLGR